MPWLATTTAGLSATDIIAMMGILMTVFGLLLTAIGVLVLRTLDGQRADLGVAKSEMATDIRDAEARTTAAITDLKTDLQGDLRDVWNELGTLRGWLQGGAVREVRATDVSRNPHGTGPASDEGPYDRRQS